ncbi:MAG TPA: DUF2934 domain-containing protein [Methylophilaceae bacterium]|nr:DUF2934 domain-containing protein [Methylophilaceae bacterium]
MAATKSTSKSSADKTPTTRKPRATAAKAADDKKPVARKTTVKTAGAEKKTSSRGTSSRAASGKNKMSPEERYRMVEVAAYYIAERNNFSGSPVEYWSQAEAQISILLGE